MPGWDGHRPRDRGRSGGARGHADARTPARGPSVAGRPDGVLPVGDRAVRPAAHLVPEPAGAPERPHSHGSGHDDARSHGGPPHAGVISTTYGTPSYRSPSAAWNSGRGRRRARSAAARSHAALVRRTTWPPAPTGSQRSSARSLPPGVVAVTPRRHGTRTRTGPVGSGACFRRESAGGIRMRQRIERPRRSTRRGLSLSRRVLPPGRAPCLSGRGRARRPRAAGTGRRSRRPPRRPRKRLAVRRPRPARGGDGAPPRRRRSPRRACAR